MKIKEIIAIILVLVCTAVTISAILAYQKGHEEGRIVLLARAPEQGNFTPREINVERGKEINLTIRNVNVVSHGFYIPEVDVMVREIKAGEVEELKITFPEPGDYLFLCTVWCSPYHMQMSGRFHVR